MTKHYGLRVLTDTGREIDVESHNCVIFGTYVRHIPYSEFTNKTYTGKIYDLRIKNYNGNVFYFQTGFGFRNLNINFDTANRCITYSFTVTDAGLNIYNDSINDGSTATRIFAFAYGVYKNE